MAREIVYIINEFLLFIPFSFVDDFVVFLKCVSFMLMNSRTKFDLCANRVASKVERLSNRRARLLKTTDLRGEA